LKREESNVLFLLLYLDDIINHHKNDKNERKKLKEKLSSKFVMKDIGSMN